MQPVSVRNNLQWEIDVIGKLRFFTFFLCVCVFMWVYKLFANKKSFFFVLKKKVFGRDIILKKFYFKFRKVP